MKLRGIPGMALFAPMLLLLSGCWVSRDALVEPGDAATIAFEGSYRGSDGGSLSIAANGDGSYLMGDEEEKLRALFLDLGGGWHVAQLEIRDDDLSRQVDQEIVVYAYLPILEGERRFTLYEPVCDERLGGIEGVERTEDACEFASLDGLKRAARNVIRRIERGRLDAESEVYTLTGE